MFDAANEKYERQSSEIKTGLPPEVDALGKALLAQYAPKPTAEQRGRELRMRILTLSTPETDIAELTALIQRADEAEAYLFTIDKGREEWERACNERDTLKRENEELAKNIEAIVADFRTVKEQRDSFREKAEALDWLESQDCFIDGNDLQYWGNEDGQPSLLAAIQQARKETK